MEEEPLPAEDFSRVVPGAGGTIAGSSGSPGFRDSWLFPASRDLSRDSLSSSLSSDSFRKRFQIIPEHMPTRMKMRTIRMTMTWAEEKSRALALSLSPQVSSSQPNLQLRMLLHRREGSMQVASSQSYEVCKKYFFTSSLNLILAILPPLRIAHCLRAIGTL